MPATDGGLGTALVGEKIVVNSRSVAVTKMLGEGECLILKKVFLRAVFCVKHGSLF